jgi:tetratricopeptide (TPR) repeat protein
MMRLALTFWLFLAVCAVAPALAQEAGPATSAPQRGIRIGPAPEQGSSSRRKDDPGPRRARTRETVPADDVERGLGEAAGFLRQGRLEEAIRQLQELQAASPQDWRVTLALGRTLESAGRRDEAVALYRQAAATMAEAGPALMELQRAQRAAEDWDGALDTCLEYLERFGDQDAWVADEVESLVRTDRIGPQAIRALEKAHAARPDDQRLRELLVIARLHQGEADKAIEEATAMDRERKAHGALLARYANLAQEKGLFPAALQGWDRVLQLDPPEPLRDTALLRRARVLRDLGRLPESIAGFDAAARDGAPPVRVAALSDKADLLAQKMQRPEEALKAYRALLDELRRGGRSDSRRESRSDGRSDGSGERRQAGLGEGRREGWSEGDVTADRVRLAMAELHIRLEQPGEAALVYRSLADSAADTEVRAEALYHAGEMLLYQGKLREAQDTWYEVTDNYPKSRWVNDALTGVLMVGENTDDGGIPLTALAQAMYQQRLGRPERGMALVDEAIARYPRTRAGDRLREMRVLLLLDLTRTEDARAEADSLAVKYPESALGARAFLAVADRLASSPATEAEAEAVYLELLTRFPDALEASQARAALQKVRDRNRGSSAREPGSRSPGPASAGAPSTDDRV